MNGSTSTVDYIPRTPLDYGSLLCWASNSVGRQSQPCVFQLAPAPPPPRPAHCDLRHPAPGEAAVLCQYEDTTTNLSFVLEVWRTQQPDTLLYNLTSSQPSWRLGGLEAGAEYSLAVFSRSEAGTSARYEASFRSRGQALALDPESRVHLDTLTITPILGALIGVGVALGLVTITILAVACCRTKRPVVRGAAGAGAAQVELLSGDKEAGRAEMVMAPRKIVQAEAEDDSGFGRLYSDTLAGRYSSLNRQLCNKNIFIVVSKTIALKC